MTKSRKIYSMRESSHFNWFRTMWQFIVCKILYMLRLKLIYRIEVHGKENIPKDNKYLVCPNHLSTLDPPMLAAVLPRNIAFMAKKELFNIPLLRWWIDWLGAFAVDRENLSPSTVKTVEAIYKSKWVLGIFPQGTRGVPGEIRQPPHMPVPSIIIGSKEAKWMPFTGKIIINVGEIIPYEKDLEAVKNKWIEQIQKLTGFKYIEDSQTEDKQEEVTNA